MRASICLAAAVLASAVPALAQAPGDIVTWSAKKPAAAVKAGAAVKIDLSARIETGWHMYALVQPEGGPPPMDVAVAKGQPFSIDAQRIAAPAPEIQKNERGDAESFHYQEQVTLTVPVVAGRTAKSGTHRLPIEVTYQVCSGSICLRPFTQTIPVDVTVTR